MTASRTDQVISCSACGKQYERPRRGKLYCSKACSKRAERGVFAGEQAIKATPVCLNCGDAIQQPGSGRPKQYCSNRCKLAHRRWQADSRSTSRSNATKPPPSESKSATREAGATANTRDDTKPHENESRNVAVSPRPRAICPICDQPTRQEYIDTLTPVYHSDCLGARRRGTLAKKGGTGA